MIFFIAVASLARTGSLTSKRTCHNAATHKSWLESHPGSNSTRFLLLTIALPFAKDQLGCGNEGNRLQKVHRIQVTGAHHQTDMN
jgi:hypothetical protein